MSSGLNLYCSEGEGGSWVDVRGLVYVLGTGGYNRLLRLLGRAGYEIHRSRSSTWVVAKKPCNELVREINELVEKIISEEEAKAEAGSTECNPADIQGIANSVVNRVSGLIPSLKDVVDEVAINLETGNHVMLLGGPGSGKTLILDAIYEASSNPLYINMADASAAGIEDLIIKAGCFDIILLDEVDKAKNVTLSPLLQLLDHGGRLRITKSGKTTVIEAPWVRAVAAANPFNPRLRASNWWMPLMDRFVPIEVPQPSVDEILTFMGKVVNTEMPSWVRKLIEKYIDAITLRKAEQAAKYIATSLRKGRSEEAVRARVEKTLQTTRIITTKSK
jgi:energy-coupling factor transporter ATP-binding protein EcfA2